jgi:hypothetical protein
VQGPLFAFLEACRPCLEMPGVREQLVVWEEEVANRLKLDLVAIRATVRTKASGAAPATPALTAPEVLMPVLQVKIEPPPGFVPYAQKPLAFHSCSTSQH